ncbi:Transcription repressor [Heracleum sosnowskyi]|uniref:Transcription repressor n=1 Tax=Heracleum sosnowskyi TaxID=360622 RepID=A0AAD8M2W4_9APIA|nr:Transcription repressor [Heracleum sosnowskyi]
MAKRLKLRISRAITSSFQSCRSKDPSILPSDPVPLFFPQFTVDVQPLTPPQQPSSAIKPHHRSSFKSHVSSTFVSVGCGSSKANSSVHNRIEPQLFQWQNKEEEWQLVYHKSPPREDFCPNPTTLVTHKKKKKRRNTKKKTTADNIALFSSCEEKERGESSRSFSSDSSAEFHPILEKPRKKKKKKKKRGGCVTNGLCRLSISSSPARLSVFKKLIPTVVEGKVKDSFAVVKKSEDPYEDFKKSMMDMIWEKQMFEEADLEQLLECFLSLNSPRHHKVIVEAFAEIWNAMFTTSTRNFNAVSVVDSEGR